MDSDPRIGLAARNNAEWCDAVTRSWGRCGRFEAGLWINTGDAPPFYPNAVTLAPSASVPDEDANREGSFAVKDSFAALDLAPLGFAPLFDASWTWRDPAPLGSDSKADWQVVRDPTELARWEDAWRDGGPALDLFRPALLAERDHAFIAGEIAGRIVAGCVASRSDSVLGISNSFGAAELQAGCIAAAMRFAPGRPLVGYESGAALDVMKGLGFQALGLLRVWLREAG